MFPQNTLTDATIEALKPKAKDYKVAAGRSLNILVKPNGGKYWRFKYLIAGKHKTLSIGVFPQISVAQAIEAREKAKLLLKQGIDPSQAKQEAARSIPKINPKSVFRIDIDGDGRLTIQTDTNALKLTKSQTEAVRSFLNAAIDQEVESPC